MLKLEFVVSLIAALLYQSAAYIEGPEREENSLIPKTLQPTDYALFFEVDMADKNHLFLGTVIIRMECLQQTSDIILNMKDLSLDTGGVEVMKELPHLEYEPLKILEPTLDTEKQQLVISLERKLEAEEKIQIKLNYRKNTDTPQNPDIAFIKYSYVRKPGGNSKWVAVSKPGALNGRRLYPCIDEPAVKAEVQMHVVHDASLMSASNTWIMADQIKHKFTFVSEPYYNTPSLSTFSISFVVGDLTLMLQTEQLLGAEIRIWSDEAVAEQMDFAEDTAMMVVEFYQEYIGRVDAAYKVDLVALPFYGRIDKWAFGLITLEESLITNDDPSTQVREIEIAFTLCDVFCHQYFGPRITFKTWKENWLNMGLALFYRVPCLKKVFPNEETSIANIHLVESFIRVSSVNAEIKSRPIMVPDSHIDLSNLFQDTILAETAQFFVRMMSYFLGEDKLLEQVKNYVAEFQFKITSLDEFWKQFSSEENISELSSDVTIKDIMDSWTLKEGFARIKMTRNRNEKFVTIRQELAGDNDKADFRIIPLNFATRSESMKKYVTTTETRKSFETESETEIKFAGESKATEKLNKKVTVQHWLRSEPIIISVETNDWIIMNTRLNVLCRVEYDPITINLLEKTFMNENMYERIDVMSRTKFISDLFTSAEMGKLSYSILLKFVEYLKHEKSPLPITVALHELKRIRVALFGTEIFLQFQNYVQEILNAIIRREKFNIMDISEDNYEQYYFKKLIFTSACTFQVKECIDQSTSHFVNLFKDGDLSGKNDRIPAVLREALYCQAIKEGGYEEWEFLYSFYNSEQWEYLNDIILNALACTTDNDRIKSYLKQSLDSQIIAPRDSLTVFKSIAANGIGYTWLKLFFTENVEEIIEQSANGLSIAVRYLEILYESTWKREDVIKLGAFTQIIEPLNNIEAQLDGSKQIAYKNISWLKQMKHEISDFFKERYDAK